jgi:hypothetical protein
VETVWRRISPSTAAVAPSGQQVGSSATPVANATYGNGWGSHGQLLNLVIAPCAGESEDRDSSLIRKKVAVEALPATDSRRCDLRA